MTAPKSAAEVMREMAAQAIERDKFDTRVRLDQRKHKSMTEWMNAQRAAYVRAIPLPTDPRDAEIEKYRTALREIVSSGDRRSASIAREALQSPSKES